MRRRGEGQFPTTGSWGRIRDDVRDRKTVESILRATPRTGRTLTKRDLVPLGLAAVLGTGIYNRIGDSLLSDQLGATAAGLVLAAVACLGAALCFAELASTVPVGGSAYTYSHAAFGRLVAWMVGWLLLLQYSAGASVIARDWAAATVPGADRLVPVLGSVLIVGVTSGLYWLDQPWARGFVAVSVAAKVVFLAAAVIVGARSALAGDPASFAGGPPPGGVTPPAPGVAWLAGFVVLYFTFIGFDAVSTAAEDSRYPPKDLHRAILATLVIAVVAAFAVLGVSALVYLRTGSAHVRLSGLPGTGLLLWIGAVAGLPSGVVVFLYGHSRIVRAIRRDGLLSLTSRRAVDPAPCPAERRSGDQRIEYLVTGALAEAGLLAVSLLRADPGQVTAVIDLGTASAFAIVAVGTVVLRYRRPDLPRTFRVPFLPVVCAVTVGATLTLLVGGGGQGPAIPVFLAWLALGAVVQAALVVARTRRPADTRPTAGTRPDGAR